nr:hypothetical protein [uncultured Flavobacterium sp.]
MNRQEIEERIKKLQADNLAMMVKIYGVGFAGSVVGLIYANKTGSKFWGKVGYFIAGGVLARLPLNLMYTKQLVANDAEIESLQAQLIEY